MSKRDLSICVKGGFSGRIRVSKGRAGDCTDQAEGTFIITTLLPTDSRRIGREAKIIKNTQRIGTSRKKVCNTTRTLAKEVFIKKLKAKDICKIELPTLK